MSTYYPDGEYYEIHYYLKGDDDTQYCASYRGKPMRTRNAAEKCLYAIKKKHPSAFDFEIALYDDSGRIG